MELLISYAEGDKDIAVEVIKFLISKDVDIWVSFIDKHPSQTYENFATEAMKVCDGVVFIFTPFSSGDKRTLIDFDKARAFSKPVLAFKLADIIPPADMYDYLKDFDTVNAFEFENRKEALEKMYEEIERLVD